MEKTKAATLLGYMLPLPATTTIVIHTDSPTELLKLATQAWDCLFSGSKHITSVYPSLKN